MSALTPAARLRMEFVSRGLDTLGFLLYLTIRLNKMTDQLSTTFAALADPTRRAILARLATGEASVTELSEPFAMSMPAVSKHLKVLERAGLIARGREAQWRPCQLKVGPIQDIAKWAEHYRIFFEQSFDRLDDYLRKMKKQQAKMGKKHAGKKRKR